LGAGQKTTGADELYLMDNTMEFQKDTGPGLTVEPESVTVASSAQSMQARVASKMGEGVHRLEGVIRQYPWPIVMLGIGLGFLLARRMRYIA
jgi:hypothetical protein